MTLLALQRRMLEDVRRPLTSDFEMQPFTESGSPINALVDSYIKPNSLLSGFERLEIYNRQYWFRIIGAVSEDYPALSAVLGPRLFDALILAYLKENPSVSFTLRDLGAKLPAWLADNPTYAGTRHRLAVDVARLEWAYIEAFDRASLPPLSTAQFAGLSPNSTLALQPHLQLLDVHYPVDEIVLAVRKNKPDSDIVSNAVSLRKMSSRTSLPRVRRSPGYLAVHRFENLVYYRRIDRENFLLLTAIRDGHPIAKAVGEALAESRLAPREQASKVRDYFTHACELGWISATSSMAQDRDVH
jgi:hypothetical protein